MRTILYFMREKWEKVRELGKIHSAAAVRNADGGGLGMRRRDEMRARQYGAEPPIRPLRGLQHKARMAPREEEASPTPPLPPSRGGGERVAPEGRRKRGAPRGGSKPHPPTPLPRRGRERLPRGGEVIRYTRPTPAAPLWSAAGVGLGMRAGLRTSGFFAVLLRLRLLRGCAACAALGRKWCGRGVPRLVDE